MAKYSFAKVEEYMLKRKFIVEETDVVLLIHISTVPLDHALPPSELTV